MTTAPAPQPTIAPVPIADVWLVGIATYRDDLIAAAFDTADHAREYVETIGRNHAAWLDLARSLAAVQFNADVSSVINVWIGQPGHEPREVVIADDGFED